MRVIFSIVTSVACCLVTTAVVMPVSADDPELQVLEAQDILDQAADALRQGRKLEDLAGVLKCTPEHLRRLLGLPALNPIPTDADSSVDLWAVDALDSQL